MNRQLQAGIARTIVTPPVGIMLAGTLREGPARGVERDLTATALVLSDGSQTVVLVACDAIRLRPAMARALRERIGSRLDVPVSHVLLNVSHTHAVPDPPDWQQFDGADGAHQAELTLPYWQLFEERVVQAADEARQKLRPARAGAGTGSVRIGVNRREQLPDGTMVLGEDPNGVMDPTVGVVRIDGLDGHPMAILMHYACHPDVLGPKCDLISPDYVGAARAVAETVTGATAMFLQGAAGDVDPRCGIVLGDDGMDEMRRLGGELGCEAARVFLGINTLRRRKERVAWQSAVSVVTAWAYADADAPSVEFLGAASQEVRLPLRPLPSRDVAERALAAARSELETALAGPSSLPERLVARRRASWAELQLQAVERGDPGSVDVEVQVVRLNELAIVAIPGELFVEIGMGIKARSPLPFTFVSGYSNGIFFYIPTAAAFQSGGYEIESYRNYQQPAGPTPEWEAMLTRAAGELIASLVGVAV